MENPSKSKRSVNEKDESNSRLFLYHAYTYASTKLELTGSYNNFAIQMGFLYSFSHYD